LLNTKINSIIIIGLYYVPNAGIRNTCTMDFDHSKPAVPVRAFLKADTSIIGRLIQHIEFLKDLEHKLLAFLEPPLNKHCTIANYVNETLILHTDAPVWASRIRYKTPQILLFIIKECGLSELKTIRIKVIPSPLPNTRSPDKKPEIRGT